MPRAALHPGGAACGARIVDLMRWLFINPIKASGWGGMEGWMLRLAGELVRCGDVCAVAAREESPWPVRCAGTGITVERLRFGGDLAPWTWCELARIVRRYRPDVIIAKGFRQARWARLTSPHAALAVKLPAGVELGDSLVDRLTAMAVVDRLLTDCRATRDELLRRPWLRPARVVVAYNGVVPVSSWPDESLRRRARAQLLAGGSDEGPVVVMAGRLDPAKRVDDALVAFAEASRGTRARLVVMGDGPARDALEAMAVSLGLRDIVRWLGWREDAAWLMWGADLFLHASEREGLSNAILEAMAAGLPVVATRAGGTAEAVEDGVTGRLVACGDRVSLAAAMGELLRDSARARRFGAAGAARVRERFTVPAMARAIRSAMSEVIELRRRLAQRPVLAESGARRVEAAAGLAEELPDREPGAAWQCVKATARVTVHRRERSAATALYAKRFLALRWRDRVVSWFRRPRAWANYRIAQRLALRGFDTVPHWAAVWWRAPGGGIESVLLTSAVEGAASLDVWVRSIRQDPVVLRRAVAMAGRWLATAHDNWVIPHDLKASNLLVRPDMPTDLILLDLDNCTIGRPALMRDIVRNFAQFRRSFENDLGFAEWRRFCAAYGRARGWTAERLRRLLATVEHRAQRRGMRDCSPAARKVAPDDGAVRPAWSTASHPATPNRAAAPRRGAVGQAGSNRP